jgi:ligand-binding SRPBCC domain-containing protein
MRQQFKAEQWLPYPLETVFNFFANPENLPRLMPRWQRARIEQATFRAPPPPPAGRRIPPTIVAGDGSQMTLSFRALPFVPLRQSWLAAIGHFHWDEGFCDTQLSGPFFFWHHCHTVAASAHPTTGAAGTLLRDAVEFQLPLDPVSRVALPLVRKQMATLFAYRHRATEEWLARFESAK